MKENGQENDPKEQKQGELSKEWDISKFLHTRI